MIRICLVLLILLFTVTLNSGGPKHEVTEAEYEQIVEDSGLGKTKKRLRLREKFYPKFEEQKPKKFSGAAVILKLIAYGMVIALVVLLIYLLISSINSDRKVSDNSYIGQEEEIENIEDVDAEANYKAALAAGNYRLAIRMQFIRCLQLLTQKEHIEWEKEKTNRSYYREIRETEIKHDFRELATIFERCWYSDEDLDVTLFRTYDQRFFNFINKLR